MGEGEREKRDDRGEGRGREVILSFCSRSFERLKVWEIAAKPDKLAAKQALNDFGNGSREWCERGILMGRWFRRLKGLRYSG